MRTVWLCLLIALLPLRLWAGSAMLVEHPGAATAPTVAVQAAAHPCHETAEAAPDIPRMSTDDHAASAEQHAGCLHCDICHSVAHPFVALWTGSTAAPHATPVHRAHASLNTGITPSFKPPIA